MTAEAFDPVGRLAALREQLHAGPVTAGDVIATANDLQAGALREALAQALRDPTARSLGYWLRSHAGRPCDGRMLVRAAKGRGVVRWAIQGSNP